MKEEAETVFCGKGCSCFKPCGATLSTDRPQAAVPEDSIQMVIWRAIQKKLPFGKKKK